MIKIGLEKLNLDDYFRILIQGEKIEIEPRALDKVIKGFEFLKEFSKDKLIYGINTGLGPMAQYRIPEAHLQQLQYNLIRSHASGTGAILGPLYGKSVMISRLNTLLRGYSGIHVNVVETLARFINHDIVPCIYEHGSVGASGDLVQLAHLALGLIGEGDAWYKGQIVPVAEAMQKEGISPMQVMIREGLAILNGTSCMSGIGMVNILNAYKLLNWSVVASSLINELVESFDDHISFELNKVKLHEGQQRIAEWMRGVVADSRLIKRREDHLYNKVVTEDVLKDKVQEYYSVRCVPQVLGPVLDTIDFSHKILVDEVNSANDNPIIDVENINVFHGGNFHGDYVSFEMDKLKIAIAKLSMLAERQLNFLLNPRLNDKFPPFLNLGTLGLNFGIQGIQFTATSTVAENQTLSFPNYIHSISCNNDNQDIVSMGTNSALLARKVIDNSFEVLAIELITLLQAVDYMKCDDKLSSFGRMLYTNLRKVVPVIIDDKPGYPMVRTMTEYLKQTDLKLPSR